MPMGVQESAGHLGAGIQAILHPATLRLQKWRMRRSVPQAPRGRQAPEIDKIKRSTR
jgi:hypothetical protein